jgi:hypothetical protein
VGRVPRSTCATSRPRSAVAGGLATSAWNSLYWNNHDQPRVGLALRRRRRLRVESAKMLATGPAPAPGTPYVYQGEEIGMAKLPFTSLDDFPRHRVAEPLGAHRRGRTGARRGRAAGGCRAMSRTNARTAVQWDSSPPPASRPARPGSRSTPTSSRSTSAAPARRPGLGAVPLPAAHRPAPQRAGRRRRRLPDAAAAGRVRLRLHAHPRRHVAARARQLLRSAGAGAGARRGRVGTRRAARRP